LIVTGALLRAPGEHYDEQQGAHRHAIVVLVVGERGLVHVEAGTSVALPGLPLVSSRMGMKFSTAIAPITASPTEPIIGHIC
jgi:hypothetical protein